ncbi:predicted protein [Histoplasma capsulatum H143]|uniref:Uncharacterized protein n=1 Tax=Ajellomyces capsulatus (strain H143) TaxID=544712 RepID=C6HSX4_AJECH|nr:predicted protein [Histoplasma capsulatum H143]
MIFFQPNYIAHATSWYDSKTLDDSTLLTRIVGKRINLIDMDREHFKLELAYLSPATARPDSARRNLKSCASTGEMKHALLRRRARQSCVFEDAQRNFRRAFLDSTPAPQPQIPRSNLADSGCTNNVPKGLTRESAHTGVCLSNGDVTDSGVSKTRRFGASVSSRILLSTSLQAPGASYFGCTLETPLKASARSLLHDPSLGGSSRIILAT